MLSAHLKLSAFAIAALALASVAQAADSVPPAQDPGISPEYRAKIEATVKQIQQKNPGIAELPSAARSQGVNQAVAGSSPPPKGQDAPSPTQLMELKERTFHGDPGKAALRNEVFDYLGIKPNEAAFYVFVSTSMPKALLQAYVSEAVWAGAVLVVRGVPDGMTLAQWIKQYAEPVVGQKGITAGLTIDPILFDLYNVKSIPTIVWDETDRLIAEDCDTAELTKPGEKGKLVKVKSCRPYSDDSFFAVSGAVTLDYALTEFGEAGAPGAAKRLETLRQYLAGGKKEQKEFEGDWSSYETAEMRAAVDRANKSGERYESIMQSFQQPFFTSDVERRNRLGATGYAPGLEPGPVGPANR